MFVVGRVVVFVVVVDVVVPPNCTAYQVNVRVYARPVMMACRCSNPGTHWYKIDARIVPRPKQVTTRIDCWAAPVNTIDDWNR